PKYLREVVLPNIEAGARAAGRSLADIDICGGSFIVAGRNEEEVEKAKGPVKRQIAFYASTRTYKPVMDLHGWGETCLKLNRMSAEGRWQEMADAITDEMLAEFAVVGTYDDVVPKLKARFADLLNRISFDLPPGNGLDKGRLREMVRALRE
ncbi:MAG: LLM class flavin-dependent oxidoreductase, partial [Dehalococcoidia bacterium]